VANKSKLLPKSALQLRKRKFLLLIPMMVALGLTWRHFTIRKTPPNFIGTWRQVGGAEMMVFTGNGEMSVDGAPGSYTMVDRQHLKVDFAPMGGPRLIVFSPDTTEMAWTNESLGIVLRYRKEFGSSLKVHATKALGL
jgi:hypothetical protein